MFYTSFYIFFFFLFLRLPPYFIFFFFNDTATTEIYTLSLHDALPIYPRGGIWAISVVRHVVPHDCWPGRKRSEEHTSELQSRPHLVCRLLLEKKKKNKPYPNLPHVWTTVTKKRRSSRCNCDPRPRIRH